MAFEVTATRRRPQIFDDLAGQEFVSATLKSSIEAGRIAGAYLFCGPRGCGKTSAARIMARSLNCEKGPTAKPCGVCDSCKEIKAGNSLDVIEIDGASNNGVNDVRQIKDEALFPPAHSKYKIYIIDEVHMLSTNAFNALLKTIEEPPPYLIFIFATTEQHKVPATIKSRCQHFAFKLIPLDTVTSILRETCKEMKIEAEDEALFWIARESTGSLRDAYTLFDQVASFSDGNIRSDLIREKLKLIGLDNLNSIAEACAAGKTEQALNLLDTIIESGAAVEQLIIDLSGYYRSLLLLKCGITKEALLGYPAARFSALVQQNIDESRAAHAVELLLNLYRSTKYSLSPRFEIETCICKLCALQNWVSEAEIRSEMLKIKEALGGKIITNDTDVLASPAPLSAPIAEIAAATPPPAAPSLPPQVELVKNAFSGTVVEIKDT
ncbi:MAG: hypothetical protein Ta2G_05040 [Termitinemataceae bacterium]|nr:MAG: hypothetical protein Ta2G_05040 [Termitinemataceae bacterium]